MEVKIVENQDHFKSFEVSNKFTKTIVETITTASYVCTKCEKYWQCQHVKAVENHIKTHLAKL